MIGQPARLPLATFPTPVERAPRLAEAIGLGADDLWLKRDDLMGLGGGGNKLRKLEYFAARAQQEGADVLVTTGGPQSNHARLTAAVAARIGMRAVLVLGGTRPPQTAGNLILDHLVGADLEWAGALPPHELAAVAKTVVERLHRDGMRPFLVPFGGSDSLGARGYCTCAAEILDQVPDVRHVVTALGSGGTMAGLVAVLGADRVLGVDVGARPDAAEAAAAYASPLTGGDVIDPTTLRVRDQSGDGYKHYTPAARDALELVARTEAVILDPTYTARAMAGLIAAVREEEIAARAAGRVRPHRRPSRTVRSSRGVTRGHRPATSSLPAPGAPRYSSTTVVTFHADSDPALQQSMRSRTTIQLDRLRLGELLDASQLCRSDQAHRARRGCLRRRARRSRWSRCSTRDAWGGDVDQGGRRRTRIQVRFGVTAVKSLSIRSPAGSSRRSDGPLAGPLDWPAGRSGMSDASHGCFPGGSSDCRSDPPPP
ncbi:pyridoxal-phosphate dependent enzyme [Nocardioides sp. IC4_145]|uniref:pyridoxal-phosphate dependent enzyme n=1 Tax=Nocardioides sp. IC4_145 TaxID=2714037 RepID=UPI001A9910C4|nr:pyridoxal-phosphate dependent enzyme [Nocardioides sp. IC4_145]